MLGRTQGQVQVIGARDTLGRHYALEEAKHRLLELGIDVTNDLETDSGKTPSAILVLADGLGHEAVRTILASQDGVPAVLLDERQSIGDLGVLAVESIVGDFTTALYHVAWATMR
jgi:hypothetical protein